MKYYLAIIYSLITTGCVYYQQPNSPNYALSAHQKCINIGYTQGSDEYKTCRMNFETQYEQIRYQESLKNQEVLKKNCANSTNVLVIANCARNGY